jgi:hypothetical protein
MPLSPQQKARYQANLDRTAELLSEEVPIYAIAERLGVSYNTASGYLCDLRRKYGWQAK